MPETKGLLLDGAPWGWRVGEGSVSRHRRHHHRKMWQERK